MKRNTYSYFMTDRPNILGGWCCYDKLSDAIKNCRRKVYVCTFVKNENNIGMKFEGYLSKLLWKTLIYEKK